MRDGTPARSRAVSARGDRLVADSLRTVLAGPPTAIDPREALYREITQQIDAGPGASGPAQGPTGALSAKQRQLLLLTSLEELPIEAAATVVSLDRTPLANSLRTLANGCAARPQPMFSSSRTSQSSRWTSRSWCGTAATRSSAWPPASRGGGDGRAYPPGVDPGRHQSRRRRRRHQRGCADHSAIATHP